MSWQRIFELVRQRRLPLVVTDVAGREPVVVLPLEEYEALTSGGEKQAQSGQRAVEREPLSYVSPAQAKNDQTISSTPNKTPENAFAELDQIKNEQAGEEQLDMDIASAGLDMEERFYLEPLDEDVK